MTRTRRHLLRVFAAAVPIAVGGCTEGGTPARDDTDTADAEDSQAPPDEDTATAVEVTVVVTGPEGERTFFETADIGRVGEVEAYEPSGHVLPLALTAGGTDRATEAFLAVGAADDPREATFVHTVEGDVAVEQTFDVAPTLAEAIAAGEWDGDFLLRFAERETATAVRDALVSG